MKEYERQELLQEIERLKSALFAGRYLEAYGRSYIIQDVVESELRKRVAASSHD